MASWCPNCHELPPFYPPISPKVKLTLSYVYTNTRARLAIVNAQVYFRAGYRCATISATPNNCLSIMLWSSLIKANQWRLSLGLIRH